MRQVAAKELKQHTGEVIAHLRRGERLLLTHRGSPIAVIAPLDPNALAELIDREAARAETAGWLGAGAGAFTFWDNAEDDVWDQVTSESPG